MRFHLRFATLLSLPLLILACSDEPSPRSAPAQDAGLVADAVPLPPDGDPLLPDSEPPAKEAGPASNCDENHPDRTVGLLSCAPQAEEGYTLLTPLNHTTFLLDMQGRIVHEWKANRAPGLVAYLMNDGRLLRPGDYGGDGIPGIKSLTLKDRGYVELPAGS